MFIFSHIAISDISQRNIMILFFFLLLHVPVRTLISDFRWSCPGVVCSISRACLIRTMFVVPRTFPIHNGTPISFFLFTSRKQAWKSSPLIISHLHPLPSPFFAKWLPTSHLFLSTLGSTMSQRSPLDIVQSTMQTTHVSRQLLFPLLRVSTPNIQKNASEKSTDTFAPSS